MSTILKALNRIEEDRDSHPQPDPLRSDVPLAPASQPVGPPSFASRSGARPGVWALAAAALLVVSVGSWRLLAGSEAAVEIAKAKAPVATVPATVAGPAQPEPSAELPRVESPPAPVAPIRSERLIEVAARQPVDPGPQLLIEPEPGEALGGALRANALIADAPIARAEPRAKAVTGEWVVPSADAGVPSWVAEPVPELPAVASPPPAVRVARQETAPVVIPPPPAVRVLETTWHPAAERRSAQISVQGFGDRIDLREGDAVGTLVVLSIHPTSVVFLHGGREIKRRVGEN